MHNKNMLLGLNVFDKAVKNGEARCLLPTQNYSNIDFAVCHMDAMRYPFDEALQIAQTVSRIFADKGVELIANFEWQNGVAPTVGPDGLNWAEREDGTHRLILPREYVTALASCQNLAGVIYDEFEHTIINRNASIARSTKGKVRLSTFLPADTSCVKTQAETLTEQIEKYVLEMKNAGVPCMASEHVFPVLYHMFGKNGIIPNFKSQKESYTTVQFAIAAGAALEYNLPLWNCVDMWFMDFHPGHSPEEMYHNLLFAYLSGVNRVYVESCNPMVKDGALTPYGDAFIRFAGEYRGKARSYDISDYLPEIGVIRFDDTYWGASGIVWKKLLFGNKNLRPTRKSREYIRIFHLLTHAETNKNGINWGRLTPWSLKKHRSFSSFNSAAVFDETVRKPALSSLKLCFLAGSFISPETLSDVESLVRENGLTVVTKKRFLPKRLHKKLRPGLSKIKDGNGLWLVTPGFLYPPLKRLIKPLLGKKGEIRLTFKNQTIQMTLSPDGNSFEWNLENKESRQ